MRKFPFVLIAFLTALLVRPERAAAHGEVMPVYSTAPGGGTLTIGDFDFDVPIVVTPNFVGSTMTLWANDIPSFEWEPDDLPAVPLYALPAGVPVTMELLAPVDAGASVRLGPTILDAPFETALIGTSMPGGHVHPQWRLLLPNGVTGTYRLSFRLTTTTAGYAPSSAHTLVITNVAPPTATPTTGGAVDTPTPTPTPTATATAPAALTCPPLPAAGSCRQALGGVLRMKAHDNPAKRIAKWKWARGQATALADFGDPSATTDYAWCVYDESGGAPALVMAAILRAGSQCRGAPCWRVTRNGGWKYKDPARSRAGVDVVSLKPGPDGRAGLLVRAVGRGLILPDLPLAQDPAVRVQLLNGLGECWQGDYATPAARNGGGHFADAPE